ncbi:MAG: Yip1 family protein [Dehalococcoidia bacterium]
MDPSRVLNWLGRVIRLDTTAFDEIKIDPSGLIAGLVVVFVTNLVIGIGTYLYAEFEDYPETGDLLLRSVIIGSIVQTIVWMAWPGVAHLLVNSVYKGRSNIQQLIATLGFAYVPAIVSFFIFITFLDWPFAILGMVGAFVLSQYAIAAATDTTSSQITMANLAGFAAFAVIMGAVSEVSTGDNLGDYPYVNGVWFLDAQASEVGDAIGGSDGGGGGGGLSGGFDRDACEQGFIDSGFTEEQAADSCDPDTLRQQCEDSAAQGLIDESECDVFD